jgi:hypothetical protein
MMAFCGGRGELIPPDVFLTDRDSVGPIELATRDVNGLMMVTAESLESKLALPPKGVEILEGDEAAMLDLTKAGLGLLGEAGKVKVVE